MSNKKFKDTKVGKFLKEKAPGILDQVGNVLPDQGVLGIIKTLKDKDETMLPQDKETAMALLNQETIEMQEVTKRWTSDMNSDSWLSKHIRPLVLIFLVVSTVLLIFIDAGVISFEVKASWVDLLQLVLITVIGAYFGGRSLEKVKK